MKCDGLPAQEREFTLQVKPILRARDIELSRKSETAALEYLKFWPKKCEAHFPFVRTGDPFFHVYMVCDSKLEAVLEFSLAQGRPATFSTWDYSTRNLPEGAERRLRSAELWIDAKWIQPTIRQ